MVSTNQRHVHEGIRKVIGSSNRGFASIDPERQRGFVAQGGNVVPASSKARAHPPNGVLGAAEKRTGEGSSSR